MAVVEVAVEAAAAVMAAADSAVAWAAASVVVASAEALSVAASAEVTLAPQDSREVTSATGAAWSAWAA